MWCHLTWLVRCFFFCFNLIPDRSNIILMTLWGKEEYRRKGQEVGDQFDGWSQENTEPWFTYFLIYKMSHAFPTHFSRDFAIKWSDGCQYALKKYFFCFPEPELLTFLLVFALKGRKPLRLQRSLTQHLSFKLQPPYCTVPQPRVSGSQAFGGRLSREWGKSLCLH